MQLPVRGVQEAAPTVRAHCLVAVDECGRRLIVGGGSIVRWAAPTDHHECCGHGKSTLRVRITVSILSSLALGSRLPKVPQPTAHDRV